jgi:hypothetical protein
MYKTFRYGDKELEVDNEFDHDNEIEFCITDEDRNNQSVYLNKKQLEELLDHLKYILNK